MFQAPSDQTIRVFPLIIGSLAILLALLNKQLLHFVKLRPLSEVFTTLRLQRSARITEKLGRLFLVMFGIGFLMEGVGTQFLSGEVAFAASIAVLGLSGLILLAIFGVVLAHWKA